MTQKEIDGWISVFQTGTDYEADLVRDRLADSGINAVIMRKKDRSFSLTQGAMSGIYVMVPPESEAESTSILESEVLTEAELTEVALAANPDRKISHLED